MPQPTDITHSDVPRLVVLCDAGGQPLGTSDLSLAHSGEGQLHLAFSVYVFRPNRQSLLIQQRSAVKRLWPLVWANTCCSHLRLGEEMGLTCELTPGPEFIYRALDPNGQGVEHEFDKILLGVCNCDPVPNPAEVAAWQWMEVSELKRQMHDQPGLFAPWFHLGLPKVLVHAAPCD